jgi:hypothetical protein
MVCQRKKAPEPVYCQLFTSGLPAIGTTKLLHPSIDHSIDDLEAQCHSQAMLARTEYVELTVRHVIVGSILDLVLHLTVDVLWQRFCQLHGQIIESSSGDLFAPSLRYVDFSFPLHPYYVTFTCEGLILQCCSAIFPGLGS